MKSFLKVFTIYGRGSHLGRVTWTIYIYFLSAFARRLHIKFGFDWPSGFREKIFEIGGHILIYSPGGGADNPLGSLTHLFSQLSHLLHVFSNK